MLRLPKFVKRLAGYDDRVTQADIEFLESLRNKYCGQRCFILGNGPSLTLSDINRISRYVTFASNKIYLLFDQTDWRPTYYTVEDTLVMQQCCRDIQAIEGTVKLLPHHMMHVAKRDRSYHLYRYLRASCPQDPLSDPNFPDFSLDAVRGICWGSTVIYSQLQLACHMGFSAIGILGLDHQYRTGPEISPGIHISAGEQNHFHPDYRPKGEKWHAPNLPVLEVSYKKALEVAQEHGIKIINCSRATKLDIFPRETLEEFLSCY